jgi:5'-3' exonuclease
VLREPQAEADDLIARFVHLHPNDKIFIISSDGDYAQLITERVSQYNGITNQLITPEGYFDDKGRLIIDKKTKEPKLLGDPQYALFLKCMRGDSSDNIFSAYPGIREKGTKNKVGLMEAYEDRTQQGYKWNTVMLSRWLDHDNVEHRVKDDYERNRQLIDLTCQPDWVKENVDNAIKSGVRIETTPQVGIHLLKFCAKYELTKISDNADTYARWLNSPYTGVLNETK